LPKKEVDKTLPRRSPRRKWKIPREKLESAGTEKKEKSKKTGKKPSQGARDDSLRKRQERREVEEKHADD